MLYIAITTEMMTTLLGFSSDVEAKGKELIIDLTWWLTFHLAGCSSNIKAFIYLKILFTTHLVAYLLHKAVLDGFENTFKRKVET